jgi:hypothetical protein
MYSEFRDPFTCCIVGCNTMRNHHANNSSSNLWFDPFYEPHSTAAQRWFAAQEEE